MTENHFNCDDVSKGDEDEEKGYRKHRKSPTGCEKRGRLGNKGRWRGVKEQWEIITSWQSGHVDIAHLCGLPIFVILKHILILPISIYLYCDDIYAGPIHPTNTHTTYNKNTPYFIGQCDAAMVTRSDFEYAN